MAQKPRPLIAGNWKMNGLRADGLALVGALVDGLRSSPPACEVLVCPPAPLLFAVRDALGTGTIALGAQDCPPRPHGPFTGDVAAPRLAADPAEQFDLFYGTPVHARHSNNFIYTFDRLMKRAEEVDPDNMIRDSLLASSHGFIYAIAKRHQSHAPPELASHQATGLFIEL